MLNVQFKRQRISFRSPFTTSHETKSEQESFLVAISYNGKRGIGEAPIISYYPYTMDSMAKKLQEKAETLQQYAFTEPARFWHFCHHLFSEDPFLVCALDLAYWDLYSQVEAKSIASILGYEPVKKVQTFYTLGMDSLDNMKNKMKEQPWPQYKVKITDQGSINTLKLLMQESESDFAVDANTAWTYETAVPFIKQLQDIGVLFIEQPLAADDWDGMKKLKQNFRMSFIADESFQNKQDLTKCADAFDGINIKLTKCSGLTPAVDIIKEAKTNKLKTMLGCMNESELGVYAAAQLGAQVDYCDLDGPILLDAPLRKLRYEKGHIILADLQGAF